MRWHLWVPKVSGPLAPCVEGYERWLMARGHPVGLVQTRRWQLGELSAWLEREGLMVGDLADPLVRERFAAAQRAAGHRSLVSRLSLRVPVAYLREIGLVSVIELAATGPVEELLAAFRAYLASERGLTAGTIKGYERGARVFLEDRVAQLGGLQLERLIAGDVSGFLVRECPRRSVSAARDLAARLRQLLRYLHVVGLIEAPLVWAVPPVADLRGRSLPKAVAPGVITTLLASCEMESVIGRRDFAVLLLLSRLGMRAGDVAAIGLDDVDWRAGELLVHGKGHREDTMPVPVDVGEALVGYLRVRPASEDRALFLCAQAPFGPISSHVVAMIVRRACRRARIPEVGPHRLRHYVEFHVRDIPMLVITKNDIATVALWLGHESTRSTEVYLHSNTTIKQEAIDKIAPIDTPPGRYKPSD
ncbi:MAG: tyrosine-type recombinase/integrase, partial [Trebonia sp.]